MPNRDVREAIEEAFQLVRGADTLGCDDDERDARSAALDGLEEAQKILRGERSE
jgi:hypothetical protein